MICFLGFREYVKWDKKILLRADQDATVDTGQELAVFPRDQLSLSNSTPFTDATKAMFSFS